MNFTKFKVLLLKNEQELLKEDYTNLEKTKNILRFNCLGYDTTLDLNTNTFTRENNDYLFFLDFNKSECQIQLKQENLHLDIHVDYCEINLINNKIIIEYSIETDDQKFKIEIEKSE